MLQGKFTLGGIARVGLPQNGMAVTGHNLTTLKGGPDVFFDGLVGRIFTDLRLHFSKPDKHLLIGKAMEGTSKPIKGSSVGEERVREGRTNKFSCVSRNISTFVVTREGGMRAAFIKV